MMGTTTGTVRLMLRLEGLAVLIASLLIYAKLSFEWRTFAICFLIPDISLAGYLVGSRTGSVAYNSAHSYLGAIALLVSGFLLSAPMLLCIALIWSAHIGFDRSLGYGLKYAVGFGNTHLGTIGQRRV